MITGTAVDSRTTAGDGTEPKPVRAALIRAIIRNLYIATSEMDPHGIQMPGALIDQRLDLDDMTFTHCRSCRQ